MQRALQPNLRCSGVARRVAGHRQTVRALAQPCRRQAGGRNQQSRVSVANVSEVATVTDNSAPGSPQDFEIDEVIAKELQDNGEWAVVYFLRSFEYNSDGLNSSCAAQASEARGGPRLCARSALQQAALKY